MGGKYKGILDGKILLVFVLDMCLNEGLLKYEFLIE